jgi:hypothetical protein
MGTGAQTHLEMTRDYPRASKDLLYEIRMIYLLRAYLAGHVIDLAFHDRPDQGLPARNASIESFAIHVRNVIAFLYNIKGRGSEDHQFAIHYVTDTQAYRKARPKRPGSPLDRAVVDRIHTQVAHLNYGRGEYPPEERLWLYDEICGALDAVIRAFLRYVDPAKVSPDFVDGVQRVLPSAPSNHEAVSSAAHTTFESAGPTTAGTATAGMPRPKP